MWCDDLARACEQAFASDPHPATDWLIARGVPRRYLPGVGVGVLPPLDYPPEFLRWAERALWASSPVLVLRHWGGQVAGFQVRLTAEKRYDTFQTNPKVYPIIWGADVALARTWATRHLILTEGPFDALACRLAGAENVVSTLTAKPSRRVQAWIARLADRLTVLYDMDEPGREGAAEVRKLFPRKFVSTPVFAAHDPWDLWVSRPEALKALVR